MEKNTKPVFSVITCTLNSEAYIEKCIKSLASQKFKKYEHIIVDGFSKDKTINVINNYKKGPSKIMVYKTPANGISNAFNFGIKKAKGKYIYFLNSDDALSDPNVLSDVYKFLKKNKKTDWIYAKIKVVDNHSRIIGTFPDRKIFQIGNRLILKYINYIPHQAVFAKNEVFKNFGLFDEKLFVNMDIEYWLRIKNHTNFVFFDRVIADYAVRSNAVSSSKDKILVNRRVLESVQKRYLNKGEMFLVKIINRVSDRINKTYR